MDFLGKWQVHVSVYCARRIPAHLGCTQCLSLLHHIDICFLPYICLWKISQIQTCLRVVVGPGFVSISPAFMRSSAIHSADPHGRLSPQNSRLGPHCCGREVSIQFAQQFQRTAVTSPPLIGCINWSLLYFAL